MGKIFGALVFMIMLNVALMIFICEEWDPETGECLPETTTNTTNQSGLMRFLLQPQETDDEGIWKRLFSDNAYSLLAMATAAVVIAGLVFYRTSDPIFIAISLGLVASLVYPSIKLWQIINASGIVEDPNSRVLLATIIVGTLIVVNIFILVDYARGRD